MTSARTIQLYAQANEFTQQRTRPNSGAPFIGIINSVQNETEFMKVQHHGGSSNVRVLHPYVGSQHWHRIGPDSGQRVLLQVRQDSKEPEASAYYQTDTRDRTPQIRATAYRDGTGLYRPLQQGEQEIVSSGVAQTFWSRRGIQDSRGGLTHAWLDQDKLEAGQRAPAHTRQGYLHTPDAIGDEERFGVVTRPDAGSPVYQKYIDAPPSAPAINPTVNASAASDPVAAVTAAASSLVSPNPAKEYLRVLTSKAGPLVDTREGHVTNDIGAFVAGKHGKNLRYNKTIYGATGQSAWESQVDEDGNWYILQAATATKGFKLDVPAGKFHVKSGTATAELMFDGVQGIMEMKSSQSGLMKAAQSVKVDSKSVKLGMTDAAVHKLLKTQIYKAGSNTFTNTLMLGQTAEGAANLIAGITINALGSVFMVISAAPLCPGVLVGLMGRAATMVPTIFHSVVPVIKTLKGAAGVSFTGVWDTYESSEVQNS